MASSKTGGGSATQLGINLQNRVTAWLACHVLAERSVTAWGMPADAHPQLIRCETEQPVDDIFVGFVTPTGMQGRFFVQVKRNPSLSQEKDSALASFFGQAVRQCLASEDSPASKGWNSPLTPDWDRILLVVSGGTSNTVAVDLREVLQKVRELGANEPLVIAGGKNNQHASALQVAMKHVGAAWRKEKGVDPTEREIQNVLRFIHTETLDVEEDRPAESEARSILRGSLLPAASDMQVDHAWRLLQDLASGWASRSSGGELPTIQRALLMAGIALNAPPSVKPLVDVVHRHSARELQSLGSDFSRLRPSPSDVDGFTINRTCMTEMLRMASEGSFLIVGEPGAGKSGAQFELASRLMRQRDVIVLRADRPREFWAPPLRDLDTFVALLERWPGDKPGIVIIDALDAARAEGENIFLHEMITRVAKIGPINTGRPWHVVASIRKFDLRYGEKIQELFTGKPSSQFFDVEFARIRHLNVSLLDEAELKQIWDQSLAMKELYGLLDEATQRILRNPFYLSLAALLLRDGLSAAELGQVRSELELLDRYWSRRVIRESGGDAREKVLRALTKRMIETRRLLVERQVVVDAVPMLTAQLEDLLHHGVLSEFIGEGDIKPQREILSFPHHLLFDAAIERLELRISADSLASRLAQDPELAIVIRPSFRMHFHYLWERNADRREFWKTALLVADLMDVPQVARVMGPAAAAELFHTLSDVQPLLDEMQSSGKFQTASFDVFKHFIGAALAMENQQKLLGSSAAPWAALAAAATEFLHERTLPALLYLLRNLTERPQSLTSTQFVAAGEAARSTLRFMLTNKTWHEQLGIPVQLVCRTFESNQRASGELLRTFFNSEFVRDYGHVILPRIAQNITWIKSDSVFIKDLYITVFTHDENRIDRTSISGTVLRMISNRKQDYNSARYALNEAFDEFLHEWPAMALQAALVTVAHSIEQRPRTGGTPPVRPFTLYGQNTGLIADYSSIWDQSKEHRGYEAISMLDDFEAYLGEISEEQIKVTLRSLVEIVVNKPRHAIWWRRLLRVGAKHPDSFGLEIREVATLRPLLTSLDTIYETANFLGHLFPLLSPTEKAAIEHTILELTPSDCLDIGVEQVRGQLLAVLPADGLTLPELRKMRKQNVVANRPHFEVGQVQATLYTEEDWLKDQGVSLEDPSTQAFRRAIKPVREFCSQFEATPVTEEAAQTVKLALETLFVALSSSEAASLNSTVLRTGTSAVAEAAELLASAAVFEKDAQLLSLVRNVLLMSAHQLAPKASGGDDEDDSSLVSTGPRYSAAGGLIALVVRKHCIDEQILSELQCLSMDPVRSVRMRVAQEMDTLARALPVYAWRIIQDRANHELNTLVLGALVGSISRLATSDPVRVISIAKTIFSRTREMSVERRTPVLKATGRLFLWFWLNHGDKEAQEVIDVMARHPKDAPEAMQSLIVSLRDGLTRGRLSPTDPIADLWRERAFGFLASVSNSSASSWQALVAQYQAEQIPERRESLLVSIRAAAGVLDTIGQELFFGSGAYAALQVNSGGTTLELKKRFLKEAAGVIHLLSTIGFASVAHNLVQTLSFLADADPAQVFNLVAKVVEGGAKDGYQNDSLAVKEVVNLVERYLAQHKDIFRDNSECRQAIIDILGRFIEADWPEARRLTYQLEDVYR